MLFKVFLSGGFDLMTQRNPIENKIIQNLRDKIYANCSQGFSMTFDNLILSEFTSCMKTTKFNFYGTKQPVKILLFKLKRNFHVCRFIKMLTKLRPWFLLKPTL